MQGSGEGVWDLAGELLEVLRSLRDSPASPRGIGHGEENLSFLVHWQAIGPLHTFFP